MSTIQRLCAQSAVPENAMIRVTLGEDLDICVTNIDGKFYAAADRCGHMNAPLSRGELEGSVVTCPMHMAQFDFITGKIVRPPNQPQSRPEAAAVALAATAVAAPIQVAPTGTGVANVGLRAMVRTLPIAVFEVQTRDGELLIELP